MIDRFIEAFRRELLDLAAYCDKTVSRYIGIVYSYCAFAEKELHINPLSSDKSHVAAWFANVRERGLGKSALNQHKAAVRLFFEYLVKADVIASNPATHLPPVRGRPARVRSPVPKAVMAKILQSMRRTTWMESRNFVMVSILWALGLRVKELVSLRVCDLDLGYDPEGSVGTVLVHGKGRKERRLFVVDRLYRALRAYVEHPESPKKPKKPLFSHYGKEKSVSTTRARQVLQEAARMAGVSEKITPHMLRHTFATELYHNGVPIDAIKEILGHESVIESAIYIHISEKVKADILETLSVKGGYHDNLSSKRL